jgi:hypothetical protein
MKRKSSTSNEKNLSPNLLTPVFFGRASDLPVLRKSTRLLVASHGHITGVTNLRHCLFASVCFRGSIKNREGEILPLTFFLPYHHLPAFTNPHPR